MKYKKELKEEAYSWGIDLNEEQLEQFRVFLELLKKWNKKINLTAIESDREIVYRHFLDSLTLLSIVDFDKERKIIDIGSGAGFPSLPLKIACPKLKFTLLEAVKKKVTFLRHVSLKLDLSFTALHGRAEDYGRREEYREQYYYAVARAVASLNILVEYSLPFIKPGGKFIAYKGKEANKELEKSKSAINKLGGQVAGVEKVSLPQREEKANLVVIDKVRKTPNKYPRQVGKPANDPL